MDQSTHFNTQANRTIGLNFPKTAVIGFLLVIALIAFEIFNFDTTRYALQNLLGDVNFWGLRWATILAIAFCSIDFAGLARLFTPERGSEEPKAVWYLMGAWLMGATMNALMTWWAVSLTLLTHEFGNEVMSRQQLLQIVEHTAPLARPQGMPVREQGAAVPTPSRPNSQPRIRQRPPMPPVGHRRVPAAGMQARSRNR